MIQVWHIIGKLLMSASWTSTAANDSRRTTHNVWKLEWRQSEVAVGVSILQSGPVQNVHCLFGLPSSSANFSATKFLQPRLRVMDTLSSRTLVFRHHKLTLSRGRNSRCSFRWSIARTVSHTFAMWNDQSRRTNTHRLNTTIYENFTSRWHAKQTQSCVGYVRIED